MPSRPVNHGPADPPAGHRWFGTTHWSVVLATRDLEPERARDALEQLCATYWYPVYAYIRRRGHSATEAEDLTQSFFERLLAQEVFARLTPEKGRFRSFLAVSINHYLEEEDKRAHCQKRGARAIHLSLDALSAEERYRLEPAERCSPDQLFERRWALTVIETALNRLKEKTGGGGRADLFEQLRDLILGDRGGVSYAELGRRLGMSEGTVSVTVHNLRRQFGQLCREEVANTVNDPAEVDEEIRYLFRVLGR